MLVTRTWTVYERWKDTVAGNAFSCFNKTYDMDGEVISRGNQSEVFFVVLDGKVFYVKRYRRTKGISSWVGYSRLRIETRNQQWFDRIGVPGSQVVGFGEERFLLKTLRGVLVTEGIEHARDLETIVENDPAQLKDKRWFNDVAAQLADITRVLHSHRFCHNDLHWRNVLVQQCDDRPKIYLIDCPFGRRFFGPFLTYRIIKDLACLNKHSHNYLSRSQRLRFLLLYLQKDRLSKGDKKMVRKIVNRYANRKPAP